MSNTKKMIQINPELFKFAGNKTRKNMEKKEKPIIPFIKAGNLKDKFLNRIKEHKTKEISENNTNANTNTNNTDSANNSDEFYGALKYLSEIPKKQKKEHLHHNKSIKKEISPNTFIPHVELDLPPELQEPVFSKIPHQNEPIVLKYKVDNDVPHGCLRGGLKPTYRTWQQLTRKNNGSLDIVDTSTINITREKRLQMIKNKLKNLETPKSRIDQPEREKPETEKPETEQPKIEKPEQHSQQKQQPITEYKQKDYSYEINVPNTDFSKKIEPLNINNIELPPNKTNESNKKIIKKIIRKKYTLGKSNIYRKVGVLIKNKQTRKNILNAHKDLKKTPISDVKNYLKEHGIIKVGSSAPNDVLRKSYEFSKLAGEITNTNKETLLHNFMNTSE